MSFVKLDTGILDSTLWLDRDERDVFVTALLMAEPYELLEPVEQIAADSLERTGFVVPAGWYGFIKAAGPGIARRALVSMQEGIAALVRLGSPDPESRTPDHEGRRMVRVSGGYLVLNFMKYRDKDHGSAYRQKNYRERKKSGDADLMDAQGYRCDCCGCEFEKPYSRYVVRDHNHETGQLRGLVCQSCNKVIGQVENGKPVYSDKVGLAIEYVSRYARHVTPEGKTQHVTYAESEAEASFLSDRSTTPDAASPLVGVFEGHADPKPAVIPPATTTAIALRKAGLQVTGANPDLIQAVAEGVTVDHLLDVMALYPGKPAKYVINAARREWADSAGKIKQGQSHEGNRKLSASEQVRAAIGRRGDSDAIPGESSRVR